MSNSNWTLINFRVDVPAPAVVRIRPYTERESEAWLDNAESTHPMDPNRIHCSRGGGRRCQDPPTFLAAERQETGRTVRLYLCRHHARGFCKRHGIRWEDVEYGAEVTVGPSGYTVFFPMAAHRKHGWEVPRAPFIGRDES